MAIPTGAVSFRLANRCEANGLFASLGGTNGPFASFSLVWVPGLLVPRSGSRTVVNTHPVRYAAVTEFARKK
ncbi:hypothetical protein [Saccharopolyspora spinosa]|nr:hypothetical protein [Saccharopolyspora spinosa]